MADNKAVTHAKSDFGIHINTEGLLNLNAAASNSIYEGLEGTAILGSKVAFHLFLKSTFSIGPSIKMHFGKKFILHYGTSCIFSAVKATLRKSCTNMCEKEKEVTKDLREINDTIKAATRKRDKLISEQTKLINKVTTAINTRNEATESKTQAVNTKTQLQNTVRIRTTEYTNAVNEYTAMAKLLEESIQNSTKALNEKTLAVVKLKKQMDGLTEAIGELNQAMAENDTIVDEEILV